MRSPGSWPGLRIPPKPVVLVDEEPAPARAYGDWWGAMGLPDLAEKARTLPETAVDRHGP
ncbi:MULTISPECIES: hypothetical protein [unclassified Rhodococcus (in: high G+C Gram-positive bacteria)]|uniref:hypothetical protein n=1 Tax=unclassified Rhodococcus (in: high G+C Gram-positive bacteria) TaxID=192944 RepID=UPI0020786F62|nr:MULTISPECIES: hypothetical protein [unclassified Rhodococcus (in: high G+C Gram-positive bacteria)]